MRIQSYTLPSVTYGHSSSAQLTMYLQDNVREQSLERPAVVICPGGGYEYTSKREGEPIALAFLQAGYQAFVLDYTVLDNHEEQTLLSYSLMDVAHSVAYIRSHASSFMIDPDNITLLGCSAGGHLSAIYSNRCMSASFQSSLSYTKADIAVQQVILCYPVIDMTLGWPYEEAYRNRITSTPSLWKAQDLVHEHTPPTFLWHTATDASVPVINTYVYAQALAQFQIDHECHIFHQGKHGLSLATKQSAKSDLPEEVNAHASNWLPLALAWLAEVRNN